MNGNIIKELRKSKKITQAQLAANIGVKQSTIACIEVGKREPSRELLIDIANYFNVSIDYLLKGPEAAAAAADSEVSLVKELLIHLYKSGLIKDINNIDENTTNIIMGMVKKELELISKK